MNWQPIIPWWWSHAQRERLALLRAIGGYVAYWVSDSNGQPAEYGVPLPVPAGVGVIHTEDGPLRKTCGKGQLHATRYPIRWSGCRVWVVVQDPPIMGNDDKSWSLRREIIGEVFPQDDLFGATGLRATIVDGINFKGTAIKTTDLAGVNLSFADLSGADLSGADLRGADLRGADLKGAVLKGADLSGANLVSADLRFADLRDACLVDVYLGNAYLKDALL